MSKRKPRAKPGLDRQDATHIRVARDDQQALMHLVRVYKLPVHKVFADMVALAMDIHRLRSQGLKVSVVGTDPDIRGESEVIDIEIYGSSE